jgi:hypothetical protein
MKHVVFKAGLRADLLGLEIAESAIAQRHEHAVREGVRTPQRHKTALNKRL